MASVTSIFGPAIPAGQSISSGVIHRFVLGIVSSLRLGSGVSG